MENLVGTMAGSYRLARLLGTGGMGSVYLGEHKLIKSRVAVKVLHPEYSNCPQVLERFFDEARTVNLIGHENIVKVFDLGTTPEGRHYFVMEYIDGITLDQY